MKKATKVTLNPIVLMTVGSFHGRTVERFKALGATVLVAEDLKSAGALYKKATHLFLPGGADIHPAQYGQRVTFARRGDAERDEMELALADAALLDGKPVFGVCRGHQVITVAAGGTLIQDICRVKGKPHAELEHKVTITPDSLLAKVTRVKWVGAPSLWVNSYHHQAVDRLPRGWKVSAQARDGVIEGIQREGWPVLSVQWHPEAMDTYAAINMFRGFLALSTKGE